MTDRPDCPICGAPMEDQRHVSIECGYEIHEVVPRAHKRIVFRGISPSTEWAGTMRRYPAGERAKQRFEAIGPDHVRLVTEGERCDPITLIEQPIYVTACCKPCRGDFLELFGEWARGVHVASRDRTDQDCIPIREFGRTIFISEAEWMARETAKDGSDSGGAP